MLNAIRRARGCVVTTPEGRIDFDNFVLWALDPFLLAFTRDGFLRTLKREMPRYFQGCHRRKATKTATRNADFKSNGTFTSRRLTEFCFRTVLRLQLCQLLYFLLSELKRISINFVQNVLLFSSTTSVTTTTTKFYLQEFLLTVRAFPGPGGPGGPGGPRGPGIPPRATASPLPLPLPPMT